MTIKEMAQMTGLSSALLSQLERNIGNPTLSALSAIAHTLNVPLSDLVQERVENKELILRKNERRRVAYIKNSEWAGLYSFSGEWTGRGVCFG